MKYIAKPNVIEAVQFDVEKWLYRRQEAYPMVTARECHGKPSSLGKYFMYEPVISTPEGDKVVRNNDFITTNSDGENRRCAQYIFWQTYEELKES